MHSTSSPEHSPKDQLQLPTPKTPEPSLPLITTAHLLITAHLASVLAGLKPKLAEFSFQFIQLGPLSANILFNLRWRMPLSRKLACGKPFRMLA